MNIVEEPEQNLFPSSQRLLLNSLLSFNNGNNMLIMTGKIIMIESKEIINGNQESFNKVISRTNVIYG